VSAVLSFYGTGLFAGKLQFWGVDWVGCNCFGFVFVNGLVFGRVLFWGVARVWGIFGCFCVFGYAINFLYRLIDRGILWRTWKEWVNCSHG
jgi:hypothetical protein